MTKEKSCGALVYRIYRDRIQMLIIKHRMGGHWSYPKGHVENDETETETALREVLEETGLSIRILDNFREQVSYSPYPGVSKDVVYFLGYAKESKTRKQVEEISDIRWVDLSQCHKYLTYPNDKMLLDHAKKYLRQTGRLPLRPRKDSKNTAR